MGTSEHVLDRHLPAGVLAAAEQVDRQARAASASGCDRVIVGEVLVQRHAALGGGRAREGERDGRASRSRPSRDLFGVPSSAEQRARRARPGRSKAPPAQRRPRSRRSRSPTARRQPSPPYRARVAVAQLQRLGAAGRCARRHRRRAGRAARPARTSPRPSAGRGCRGSRGRSSRSIRGMRAPAARQATPTRARALVAGRRCHQREHGHRAAARAPRHRDTPAATSGHRASRQPSVCRTARGSRSAPRHVARARGVYPRRTRRRGARRTPGLGARR